MQQPLNRVPVIDISPLVTASQDRQQVADAIGQACRTHGFFYIVGHGVSEELQDRLEAQSKAFFAQDLATKNQIPMALAGKAWRGFFPVGGELTSGKPDIKEGLYFGIELDEEDPRVKELTVQAYQLLKEQAAKIRSAQVQHSFLHKIPVHREISYLFHKIL